MISKKIKNLFRQLISGFRWSFYENADVSLAVSLGMVFVFLAVGLIVVAVSSLSGKFQKL